MLTNLSTEQLVGLNGNARAPGPDREVQTESALAEHEGHRGPKLGGRLPPVNSSNGSVPHTVRSGTFWMQWQQESEIESIILFSWLYVFAAVRLVSKHSSVLLPPLSSQGRIDCFVKLMWHKCPFVRTDTWLRRQTGVPTNQAVPVAHLFQVEILLGSGLQGREPRRHLARSWRRSGYDHHCHHLSAPCSGKKTGGPVRYPPTQGINPLPTIPKATQV